MAEEEKEEKKARSDFSHLVRRVWEEDQLREQIDKLEEENRILQAERDRILGLLKEKEAREKELEKKLKEEVTKRDNYIKELQSALKEKDNIISNLRREKSLLIQEMEEQKKKGVFKFFKK